MKVRCISDTDMTTLIGIWEPLISIIDETKANALIVNDKKYFYYILRTMGIQDDIIADAWKHQKVTIPDHGLIYIFRKQTMKNACKNAILLFPDQDLIARAEADAVLEQYSVIFDSTEINKILTNKLTLPTDI